LWEAAGLSLSLPLLELLVSVIGAFLSSGEAGIVRSSSAAMANGAAGMEEALIVAVAW
jgi:hypothetical protein